MVFMSLVIDLIGQLNVHVIGQLNCHVIDCHVIDIITMTLKMTTAQVVETSVTVTNSSFQDYTHPDDHTTRTNKDFYRNLHLVTIEN